MASLEKIEEMCQKVGYEIPDWLANKTYMDKDEGEVFQERDPGGHFSGILRGVAENFFGGDDQQEMFSVIFEAAERLDDAHEMWLERKVKDQTPLKNLLTDKDCQQLSMMLTSYCEDCDSSKSAGRVADRLWNKIKNAKQVAS